MQLTYARALETVLSKGERRPTRWPRDARLAEAERVWIDDTTEAWSWSDVGPYAPGESVDDAESVLAIWYQTPSFAQNDCRAEVLTSPLGHAPGVRLLVDDHGESYFVELAFFGRGDQGLLVVSRRRGGLAAVFDTKLTWSDLATWTLGYG